MPTKQYYLDSNKTEPLTIEWKGIYKDFKVSLKDSEVLHFENKKALENGAEYRIDENRLLTVRLTKKKYTGFENLEILVNNEPVKGSPTDPFEIVKGVCELLFVIAALNVILGLIAELFSIELLLNYGLGFGTVIAGLIYTILGFLIKLKNSLIALVLSIFLLAADAILSFASMASGSATGFTFKLIFILLLWRGIRAIREIKKRELKAIGN